MRRLRQLLRDQSGASAVEYGLILAFGIGLAMAIVYFFGHTLHATRNEVTSSVENPETVRDAGVNEGRDVDAGGFIRRSAKP